MARASAALSAAKAELVQQSVWRAAVQTPKTHSAVRKVHLCRELADLLKNHTKSIGMNPCFRNGNEFTVESVAKIQKDALAERIHNPISP